MYQKHTAPRERFKVLSLHIHHTVMPKVQLFCASCSFQLFLSQRLHLRQLIFLKTIFFPVYVCLCVCV